MGQPKTLILLGGVDIATGQTLTPWDIEWPAVSAPIFPFNTFAEALAAPPRPNSEGYVVHFRNSDVRIKIKQADYVALHKIVTGWRRADHLGNARHRQRLRIPVSRRPG